jgi:cellulose biosynthesis protein BcsQ
MKTVAIFNRKGGTGRTTLAAHLARRAQARDVDTVAVSLGHTGDLVAWLCQDRQAFNEVRECGKHLIAIHSPKEAPQLPQLQSAASLLVYDCPCDLDLTTEIKPDLWIVPVSPERASMERLGQTLREATSGAEMLLVSWGPMSGQDVASVSALRDLASQFPHVQVWENAIRQSDAIVRAQDVFGVAWDLPHAGEGARELANLCDGVLARLALATA